MFLFGGYFLLSHLGTIEIYYLRLITPNFRILVSEVHVSAHSFWGLIIHTTAELHPKSWTKNFWGVFMKYSYKVRLAIVVLS